MAKISLKGTDVTTSGNIPQKGEKVPDFKLVATDLQEVNLENYTGKKKVLNIFPSVDTPTCAQSVRSFTEKATAHENTIILHISADLPFAGKRSRHPYDYSKIWLH